MNGCYTENVYVYGNIIEFENDIAIDTKKEVIDSMSKCDMALPEEFFKRIKGKRNAVIIGDQLTDLHMADFLPRQTVISFGFLESNVEENEKHFKERFDAVLTENEGFDKIK